MTVPRPGLAPWTIPPPRYVYARGPLTWQSPCPHGTDATWTATLTDVRVDTTCDCTCPDEAA